MARRVGQVLLAVAAVAAVAVLARPSTPDVPPPFEVERATPEPTPAATATPAPGQTVRPSTPRRRPDRVFTVHRFDPLTGMSLRASRDLPLQHGNIMQTDVSPDGRYLAVLQQRRAEYLVQVYDLEDLSAPFEEVPVPWMTDGARFAPGGDELVWAAFHPDRGHEIGVVRLGDGPLEQRMLGPITLPPGLADRVVEPLGDARIGLLGYAAPAEPPAPGDIEFERGPLRLAVADLHSASFTIDVVLPTAAGLQVLDDGSYHEMHAGVAWDAARDRAYVAHADRDAVLVVDLVTGEVVAELGAGEAPQPLPGLPDPGDPGGEPPDEPHGEPPGWPQESRWREVLLSPDGNKLYVHGTAYLWTAADAGGGEEREVGLPLLVVDLVTGELRVAPDAGGRVLAVSGDAAHVAVATGPSHERRHVWLLDGASLKSRWDRPARDAFAAAFTSGGSRVFVLGLARDPPAAGAHRLELLDVEDGTPLQTLWFPDGFLLEHLHAGIVVQQRPAR